MRFGATCLAIVLAARSFAQEALGTWSPPVLWPVFAIHMSLLPDKSLLIWNRMRGPEDNPKPPFRQCIVSNYPRYDSFSVTAYPREIFCSGHTLLEDGTVFAAGGHDGVVGNGILDTTLYLGNGQWQRGTDMWAGRWYPTCTYLPNRRVFINMGTIIGEPATQNKNPEMWVRMPNGGTPPDFIAKLDEHAIDTYYPHMFIDPRDGNVIFAATGVAGQDEQYQTEKFDLFDLSWQPILPIPQGVENVRIDYCSSVMIDGNIIRSGGSMRDATSPAVRACLYCNLNAQSPTWAQAPAMNLQRKNHTLVALPGGQVLAMGGNLSGQFDPPSDTSRTAPEMWDPSDPSRPWKLYAEPPVGQKVLRGYHSVALLLPDARVVFAGGEPEDANNDSDPQRTAQFFSPPYGGTDNWQPLRPVISSCPETIRYGEEFGITTSHRPWRRLSSVTLVSLGSMTHAFNQNQTFVTLEKSGAKGSWSVMAPYSPKVAPPGYYMLFVNDQGPSLPTWMPIPSEARIVQLVDYTMILADITPTLNTGSFEETATKQQTYIGDNSYLGGRIDASSQNVIEMVARGTAASASANQVRVQIECKGNQPLSMKVYLYDWGHSRYDEIATHTTTAADANYVSFSADNSNGSPYVNASNKRVRAKFRWTVPGAGPARRDPELADKPTVDVDVVEFGIK